VTLPYFVPRRTQIAAFDFRDVFAPGSSSLFLLLQTPNVFPTNQCPPNPLLCAQITLLHPAKGFRTFFPKNTGPSFITFACFFLFSSQTRFPLCHCL